LRLDVRSAKLTRKNTVRIMQDSRVRCGAGSHRGTPLVRDIKADAVVE
jgi:hypothetical protein